MADNRCERCWTTTLAEKVIAEREETCWERGCTKKGTRKFFGHSVCEKHAKSIPGPLEVYAASWISAGEDIDVINEGLDRIFNKGEKCEAVKGNITTPIEWFYKWEYGKEDPKLRRGSNLLLIEETEAIMGKDGSHENCSACGNGSYKGEKLIMCDYCPRVMHLKKCARLKANYRGEYKCPKCEEEGNQTKTKGGEEHWERITTKLARIKEKEGLTLTIEEFLEIAPKDIRENEIIRILKSPDTQINPKTVNNIMETPEWSIKPRQIYDAQKIQTVERTRVWVREVIRKSKQKNIRIGTQNKIYCNNTDI